MECQSVAARGAAPVRVAPTDRSALPPESVGRGSLVTEDRREVGALSGGVMLQPLSGPLPTGVGLLPNPLPAASSGRLAAPVPGVTPGRDGFTTFRVRDRIGRCGWCLYAGGPTSARGEFGAPRPGHVPFWSKPDSLFGLSFLTTLVGTSSGFTRPPLLAPDHREAGSRRLHSRLGGHPFRNEASLSPELPTLPLPGAPVRVGDGWQNSRSCAPLRRAMTLTHATSCRTRT
jgi:hypothetical protein